MTLTPMMQQYQEAKAAHPGMLLLFRMGDFYELFEEDAEVASRVLGLTLTSRDKTIPMAGFPHHALEGYLRKLLHAGHRVQSGLDGRPLGERTDQPLRQQPGSHRRHGAVEDGQQRAFPAAFPQRAG